MEERHLAMGGPASHGRAGAFMASVPDSCGTGSPAIAGQRNASIILGNFRRISRDSNISSDNGASRHSASPSATLLRREQSDTPIP